MKLKRILASIFITLSAIFWMGPAYAFASDGEAAAETTETLTDAVDAATQDPKMQKAQSLILLAICVVIVILLARRSKQKQEQDKDFGGHNPNKTPDHLDDEKKGNHFGF